jgi:hypothetical protein
MRYKTGYSLISVAHTMTIYKIVNKKHRTAMPFSARCPINLTAAAASVHEEAIPPIEIIITVLESLVMTHARPGPVVKRRMFRRMAISMPISDLVFMRLNSEVDPVMVAIELCEFI